MEPNTQLETLVPLFRNGIAFFVGLGALYLAYKILHGMTHPFRETERLSDRAGRQLTGIIIWIVGLLLFGTALIEFVEPVLLPVVPEFLLGWVADLPTAILIGLLFFQFKRFNCILLGPDGIKFERDFNVNPIRRILNAVIVSVGAILVFQTLGLDLGGLLVGGGVAVAIVGLASQESAANIVAFLIMLIDERFTLKDRITVLAPDSLNSDDGQTGIVQEQKLFSVRLRTDDGDTLSIPNNHFSRASTILHNPIPTTANAAEDSTDDKAKAQRVR